MSATTTAAPSPRGLFITFEGPEGGGKSTQIARLTARLRALGRTVLLSREPGGTPIGEQIRHLLKHCPSGEGMCAETELLLFAASRAQLVREVVAPALARGEVVLCDRFLDSSSVYQGNARALDATIVAAINAFAVGTTLPHLTLLLDVPAEESLRRIGARNPGGLDRLEREGIDFHRSVRNGYLELARRFPERIRTLDGLRSADEVEAAVWQAVETRLATPSTPANLPA